MDDKKRRTRATTTGNHLQRGLGAVKPDQPVSVLAGEIEAEAYTLRPLMDADRDAFVALVHESLDHLSPWLPVLADGTSAEVFYEQERERAHEAERTGNALRLVAECRGQIVGAFALTNITRGLSFQADASWWIGKPYLRRKYARRGLGLLLRRAFASAPDGLGLHRVMATIAPDNEPSLRLASAFGFARYEAQDHHLRIGDAWVRHSCFVADAFEYAIREVKHATRSDSPIPLERDTGT
jgi:RimJ/RimL family protein N-acetyltransferase